METVYVINGYQCDLEKCDYRFEIVSDKTNEILNFNRNVNYL